MYIDIRQNTIIDIPCFHIAVFLEIFLIKKISGDEILPGLKYFLTIYLCENSPPKYLCMILFTLVTYFFINITPLSNKRGYKGL